MTDKSKSGESVGEAPKHIYAYHRFRNARRMAEGARIGRCSTEADARKAAAALFDNDPLNVFVLYEVDGLRVGEAAPEPQPKFVTAINSTRTMASGVGPGLATSFEDFSELAAQALPERESAEKLARLFHELYECYAPNFGYKTRDESAKPWEEVPENNKQLMIAVCAEVGRAMAQAERERKFMADRMTDAQLQAVGMTREAHKRVQSTVDALCDCSDSWRLRAEVAEFREGQLKEAANNLIDYIDAHGWGSIPEPYDSINLLLKLLGRSILGSETAAK